MIIYLIVIFLLFLLFLLISKSGRYSFFRQCIRYGSGSKCLYGDVSFHHGEKYFSRFIWKQTKNSSINVLNILDLNNRILAAGWSSVFNERERDRFYKTIKNYASKIDDFEDFSTDGYKIQDIIDPTLNGLTPPYDSNSNSNALESLRTEVSVWVASIYDTSTKKFKNRIHNLCDPSVQNIMGKIFSRMIPLFEQVLDIPICWTRLKVYVKIKSIIINENCRSIPLGRLHREGDENEDISAVGLYWIHIDDVVDGGDLQLLAKSLDRLSIDLVDLHPERRTIHKMQEKFISTGIYVRQNNMLVFNNTDLYHQVEEITINKEKEFKTAERMVVAFFLVNPTSSRNVTTVDNWKGANNVSLTELRNIRNKFRNEARKNIAPPNCRYWEYTENASIAKRD